MHRFIDIGKQIGPGAGSDEDWPREFAYYDTITDHFLDIGGSQVFESWKDVANSIENSGLVPQDKVRLYRRLWSISPDWVRLGVGK